MEIVVMDFVVVLPRTLGKFDTIWVVVDRSTKLANFIPVRIGYNVEHLAKVYVKDIVRLHGVPLLSSQIMVPNSLPCFGGNFMMNLAHNLLLVQPSIR